MSVSLIVVSLGAVVAALGTGVLTARLVRTPRIYLVAWTLALFGLAVSFGAQILGYLTGYSELMFRAMEIGAQVIAPLALCLGLTEVLGRSVPARFAMRLAVSAIGVITIVILGVDPLNTAVAFSKHWPDPATFYDLVPKALIQYLLAPFAALTAIVAVVVAAVRSGREAAAKAALGPAAAAAVAALAVALPGISWSLRKYAGLPAQLSASGAFALACLLAAALGWTAAVLAGRRGLSELAAGRARYGADGRLDTGADPYQTGEYGGYGGDHLGGYDRDELGAGYGGAGYGADPDYGANGYDPAATGTRLRAHNADGQYPALAALVAEAGDPPGDPGGHTSGAGQYGVEPFTNHSLVDLPQADDDAQAQMFGQIAIYTLIEERIEEFDRLTERVVAQVRAREPDTLVYIVHAVPTAPMQRILYEVYRDRAAYDEHLQRPYVVRYQAERRPFVLATNEIELGLRQAKVSPLPSISDILVESGIDLTGVTRSPSGLPPPPGGGYPAGPPSGGFPAGPPAGGFPAGPPPAGRSPSGLVSEPGYNQSYEGWAELRGEDPTYR